MSNFIKKLAENPLKLNYLIYHQIEFYEKYNLDGSVKRSRDVVYDVDVFKKELEQILNIAENVFRESIDILMYSAESYSERELLIKLTLNQIIESNSLNSNLKSFIEEENEIDDYAHENQVIPNFKSVEHFKNELLKEASLLSSIYYQNIVDYVCINCVLHKVDLTKISNEIEFFYTLNTETYFDLLKEARLDLKNEKENMIKEMFTSVKAYDFFIHLVNHLKISNLAKYSCIYRNMYSDKLIREDISPEKFKRLIDKDTEKYGKVEQSLKTYGQIGVKTHQKYKELHKSFFQK